jgi:hypothetical protein
MDDLRYPIGRFTYAGSLTEDDRETCIERITAAPSRLRLAVKGLTDRQLDTAYRPGGWTVRQVAHHVPDSHLNAYVRFRLALTEPNPTIRPYDEAQWAELPDARSAPIDISLTLLDALHVRWTLLLRQLGTNDWARTYYHPELRRTVPLEEVLGMYAWHGEHHVAHITRLRERMEWR